MMKQISSFLSEISDQFKTVVVDAIRYEKFIQKTSQLNLDEFLRSLCQKFPRKHSVLMTFLSNMLREEGGYEYKKAIVNTIISVIEENPEAKEAGPKSTLDISSTRKTKLCLFFSLSRFKSSLRIH